MAGMPGPRCKVRGNCADEDISIFFAAMNRDVQPLSNDKIAAMRNDYTLRGLDERDLDADPIRQFGIWLADAVQAGLNEPNAMTLSTVTSDGAPDARIVLLKGVDAAGFRFFTNYESAKGRHLAAEPRASLLFFWGDLERQVRVAGRVEKLGRDETAAYFHTRPRSSQLGAWASAQSQVIPDRTWLENRFAALERQYPGEVPVPPLWGGYLLRPESLEFWQGRTSRLHDRLRYRQNAGRWMIERLSP